MDKKTQHCPYCQEDIYANAIVCRYCRRDLPPDIPPLRPTEPSWIPLLIGAALVIGVTTLLRSHHVSGTTAGEDPQE